MIEANDSPRWEPGQANERRTRFRLSKAPASWAAPCTHTECTLHQLSPYIGKLKSSIARQLIESYSKTGDLVVDPFCGSGTVPLEAGLLGRSSFASDASVYAEVLTMAKLNAPSNVKKALDLAAIALRQSKREPKPDLRKIPSWVRDFYHPDTLRDVIQFATVCKRQKSYFLLSCLLGILHHQRPGFLSYPSSHLVPYLRDKKYPRASYPEMYEYRELEPRLVAKIERAFRRRPMLAAVQPPVFRRSTVENLTMPEKSDCIITSPPYMNALDYGRDNRLRLWFIRPQTFMKCDTPMTRNRAAFERAMGHLARKLSRSLKNEGYCVLVVGENVRRSGNDHPAERIASVFNKQAPCLVLRSVTVDAIPDIRRSRRSLSGTKGERVLVFQKEHR